MVGGDAMAVGPGPNHSFARKLASSDKSTRDKEVSLLVLWLSNQQDIGEEELKKIWKGLFYCVWHADKAAVQSELIERLAGLLEKLDVELSLSFFKVFLSTMRREWGGIDRLRLDKFYLLLRKFLSHMFVVLDKGGWAKELVSKFMCALEERVFLAKDRYPALGVSFHFIDIFWDELRKFLPVPEGTLGILLEPFYSLLTSNLGNALLRRVRENIFNPLLDDARALVKNIERLQNVGGTGSSLGCLLYSDPLSSRLFDLASSSSTPQSNRKVLYELSGEFKRVAQLFDSAKVGSFHANGNGKLSADDTDDGLEIHLEESEGPSRTRLRKRQEREGAGKYVLQEVGTLKMNNAKKAKKEQAAGNGVSEVNKGHSAENGRHLDVHDGKNEEKEDQEGRTKKMSFAFEKIDRPLLHKMKETKKKKGQSKLAEANPKDGESPVLDVDTDRRERGTYGHQDQNGGTSPVVSGCNVNGHEGVSDVTINLEKKFDFVAAEELVKSLTNISTLHGSPLESPRETRSSNKKRRRDKVADQGTPQSAGVPDGTENAVGSTPASDPFRKVDADDQTTLDSVKKAKKVRFALRNNVVCMVHGPLPPLAVRTPPSATPRGSALKSGVLPGPIRTRPIRVARGTGMMKSRKRASRQLLSMSLQKPKKSTRKWRRRQSL